MNYYRELLAGYMTDHAQSDQQYNLYSGIGPPLSYSQQIQGTCQFLENKSHHHHIQK